MDNYPDTGYLSIPTFGIIQMIIIMKTWCKKKLHTIELEHITLAL